AGTVLVKDIVPGRDSASPKYLTEVSGRLFFIANGHVWKSDGTAAGTVQVESGYDWQMSASQQNLTNVGGTLFFSADTGPNNPLPARRELWKSDGTAAGTVQIKEISRQGDAQVSWITN